MADGQYQAWLVIDHNGGGNLSILPISLLVDVGVGAQDGIPDAFWIETNYPNPFNPVTRIRFGIPAASKVVLKIYDLQGRVVRTILNEDKPAGQHVVSWDGRDEHGSPAASGIYFYRLQAGSEVRTGKMALIR